MNRFDRCVVVLLHQYNQAGIDVMSITVGAFTPAVNAYGNCRSNPPAIKLLSTGHVAERVVVCRVRSTISLNSKIFVKAHVIPNITKLAKLILWHFIEERVLQDDS